LSKRKANCIAWAKNKKKYVTSSMALKRAGEMVELAAQVKRIEVQKMMIVRTPLPKFKKGADSRVAIVGESGPEMVIVKDSIVSIASPAKN
jgi:hypothetical protein